jgi:putative redox protein
LKIELKRLDDAFHFKALGPSEFPVHIDAGAGIGGHEEGARPMELVAMGLAGCAAIDFILILKKQRQALHDIRITIDAERYKDQTPSPYEKIHLLFHLKGHLDPNKVSKALALSIDKYCSVAEMVKSTATITYDFEIEL